MISISTCKPTDQKSNITEGKMDKNENVERKGMMGGGGGVMKRVKNR